MTGNTTDTDAAANNVHPFVARPRKAPPAPTLETILAGGWEIVQDDGKDGIVLAVATTEQHAHDIVRALDERDDTIRTLRDFVLPYMSGKGFTDRGAKTNLVNLIKKLEGQ